MTKEDIVDLLDTIKEDSTEPLYGIYINGQLAKLSKVRVYKNTGRARAVLNTAFMDHVPYDYRRDPAFKKFLYGVIDELIADKTIEIKLL